MSYQRFKGFSYLLSHLMKCMDCEVNIFEMILYIKHSKKKKKIIMNLFILTCRLCYYRKELETN